MTLSETIQDILFDVQFSKGRYDADLALTSEEVREIATFDIIEAIERADEIE